LAGPSKPIADLGNLEGDLPGASVCWERRHPAGLGQATEEQEGKENSWSHGTLPRQATRSATRTRCGRDARGPRGGGAPRGRPPQTASLCRELPTLQK